MGIKTPGLWEKTKGRSKLVGGDPNIVAAIVAGVGVNGQRVTRSSDGSAWIYEGGIWRLESVDVTVQDRIDSLAGLVDNGSGGLDAVADAGGVLRGENFDLCTAWPNETLSGKYSWLATGPYNYDGTVSRRPISVQAGTIYGISASVKAKTLIAGNTFFPYLVGYDADGATTNRSSFVSAEILRIRFNIGTPGAFTVTSRPIAVGATKIYFARTRAATNVFSLFTNGPLGYQRSLAIFQWTNTFGFTYPTPYNVAPGQKPYTRRAMSDAWAQNGLVELPGTDEIECTLNVAQFPAGWPTAVANPLIGGPWASGTVIGNTWADDGGSIYPYNTGLTYNTDDTWKILRPNLALSSGGCFKKFETAGGANASTLPPWTQFVRAGVASNYGPVGNETIFQITVLPLGGQ